MWDGIDRRSGPDWVMQTVNTLNVLSWVVFVIALAIFHYARPELNNIILEFHQIPVREHWIYRLKQYLFISLYISVGLSLVSLLVNQVRNKRKTDHRRYNLVFLTIVVVAFLIVIKS
ncbi:hypothetical protein J1N51_02340 [Psychrosphaera ytuae]|uniref:Uncharacterized protein n=1 Tax=Psychrosphaera ytuae TaxID=2820710 RepID=A0A975DEU9_9GAMM|nr:hypothetical protein [Psychrosphaera ytuae]QTH64345.1 hypothetical protein J1N51_02340 [Psychrosphaera ytuae]